MVETRLVSILILMVTFVAIVIATQVIRRRRNAFPIRSIRAYETLSPQVGAAIEANRPVHLSAGSAGLGGTNTLLALANAELFYRVAQQAVIGATAPLVTTSDTTAIPLGYDILRRAYESRGLIRGYRSSSVRWYPAEPRSLAFAAMLTASLGVNHVNTNVLVGSFGPELALIADAAARHDQGLIAASDQLTGQAVAYAVSDQPLIGEEMFAAGAYLGDEASYRAGLVTQDLLRWLLIIGLLLSGLAAVNPDVGRFLGSLLGALSGRR
ncbi:MAG: hypothetical protein K8J31_11650 [Anaerolineae bacterium]|nr:hypothetical protein [Anaerolineae bacterium]